MAQHSWLSKHGSFQESEKADAARSAMMRRVPARRWRVARRRSLVLPIGATRCVLWRFEMDQRQVVTEIQRSGGVQSMELEMATEMWRNALLTTAPAESLCTGTRVVDYCGSECGTWLFAHLMKIFILGPVCDGCPPTLK